MDLEGDLECGYRPASRVDSFNSKSTCQASNQLDGSNHQGSHMCAMVKPNALLRVGTCLTTMIRLLTSGTLAMAHIEEF